MDLECKRTSPTGQAVQTILSSHIPRTNGSATYTAVYRAAEGKLLVGAVIHMEYPLKALDADHLRLLALWSLFLGIIPLKSLLQLHRIVCLSHHQRSLRSLPNIQKMYHTQALIHYLCVTRTLHGP